MRVKRSISIEFELRWKKNVSEMGTNIVALTPGQSYTWRSDNEVIWIQKMDKYVTTLILWPKPKQSTAK